MKKKYVDIALLVSFLTFVLLTLLVLIVDVKEVSATGKPIGLYTINMFFNDLPKNSVFDVISDIVMYLTLLSVVFFIGLGIYEWVKRKSLKKVDFEIIYLGLFIILMAALWVVFDKVVVINYRPILIDGIAESSYPSTHVMVVTFLLLSCCYFINKKWENKSLFISSYVVASIIICLMCIFRIAAGMHWFTDILGGALAGVTLYIGFLGAILLHLKNIDKKVTE